MMDAWATPFRNVAAYLHDGTGAFGVGVVSEIFGYNRGRRGMPAFDFAVCADRPGPLATDSGLTLLVEHGLDRLAEADLVLVTSWEDFSVEPSPAVLAALRTAYERGATIAGHCTGTYVLAAAGLLDGLRATTHWRWADALAKRFPDVRLVPEVLYVDEGRIVTGAGAAAGVDMCLHLVRREYGAAVANGIARDMVVPPHRDGGQAQYVAAPVAADCDDERLAEVLGWAREHLHVPLTVEILAGRALMSQRSFARRFSAGDGVDAARLGAVAAAAPGGGAAGDRGPVDRGGGPAGRLRHRPRRCGSSSSAAGACRRGSTARPSPPDPRPSAPAVLGRESAWIRGVDVAGVQAPAEVVHPAPRRGRAGPGCPPRPPVCPAGCRRRRTGVPTRCGHRARRRAAQAPRTRW